MEPVWFARLRWALPALFALVAVGIAIGAVNWTADATQARIDHSTMRTVDGETIATVRWTEPRSGSGEVVIPDRYVDARTIPIQVNSAGDVEVVDRRFRWPSPMVAAASAGLAALLGLVTAYSAAGYGYVRG